MFKNGPSIISPPVVQEQFTQKQIQSIVEKFKAIMGMPNFSTLSYTFCVYLLDHYFNEKAFNQIILQLNDSELSCLVKNGILDDGHESDESSESDSESDDGISLVDNPFVRSKEYTFQQMIKKHFSYEKCEEKVERALTYELAETHGLISAESQIKAPIDEEKLKADPNIRKPLYWQIFHLCVFSKLFKTTNQEMPSELKQVAKAFKATAVPQQDGRNGKERERLTRGLSK